MSSVMVSWKGRCADSADQDLLIGYLARLAKSHRRYCIDGPGPRPEISRLLAKQRGEAELRGPLLSTFDGEIEGRIAVCSDIVCAEQVSTLEAALDKAGIEHHPLGYFAGSLTFPLSRLRVKGLDFQLYDPRGLYPGEDRVSCVFLQSDEFPYLDGLMAKVNGPERSAMITVEHLKGTEWYIECPFVHLREYLEHWIDLLLSWMKYFFVDDLFYFNRIELSDFERHRKDFEYQIRAGGGRDAAREAIFLEIVRRFERQADRWAAIMENLDDRTNRRI